MSAQSFERITVRYISCNLPAGKGKSTVILKRKDYLEKRMDHINNAPYQLLN